MSGASGQAASADASARARGSSFNAAMRILPRPRREAMFEIYSFCRAVDDIADEAGPRHARWQALAGWRRDIDALYTGLGPPIRRCKASPGLFIRSACGARIFAP